MRISPFLVLTCFFCATVFGSNTIADENVHLFPRLQAADTFVYSVRFRVEKVITAQSSVTTDAAPTPELIDLTARLRTEVIDVQSSGEKAVLHLRTQLETASAAEKAGQAGRRPEAQPDSLPRKIVDYTMGADGQLANVQGYDALSPEEQQAWANWISIFAIAATSPHEGVHRGEKWESQEAVKTTTPIAGLTWQKHFEYVQNEPCEAASPAGEAAQVTPRQSEGICAVILTTATLDQKSLKKDATPDDFRLHDLHTSGQARGKSQVVAYISLKTGLLMRGEEETTQSMDVTIERADGSNRVRYKVDAKSSSEIVRLSEETPATPAAD